MRKKCTLIFALDVADKRSFVRWVDTTKDLVEYYKVGLVPFIALGCEALRILKRRKKKIFLDLKFYDIPNTMIRATEGALRFGIDIIDFHLAAEKEALTQTVSAIRRTARRTKAPLPKVLGITVLTSVNGTSPQAKRVLSLARKAQQTGFNGVVASGQEAGLIRKKLGNKFIIACPGIRLGRSLDDQRRIVTPQTVKDIADYIIVGRPIYTAQRPRRTIGEIIRQLG